MRKYIVSLIEMIVVMCLTIFVFKFVIIPVTINGSSMENTLQDRSVALINALPLKEEHIDRFDIAVVHSDLLDENIIKRVIGLPNDEVEMINDVLYINGEIIEQDFLDESFIEESKKLYNTDYFTTDFKVKLNENEYFVLGDNRLRSTDSRDLGTFSLDDFVGISGIVVYPTDKIQWLN